MNPAQRMLETHMQQGSWVAKKTPFRALGARSADGVNNSLDFSVKDWTICLSVGRGNLALQVGVENGGSKDFVAI